MSAKPQYWPAYPKSLKEIFRGDDENIPRLILSGVSYELETPILGQPSRKRA